MAYTTKLGADISFSDTDRPIKGLDGDAVIINYSDIDFGTTVMNGGTITTLKLKSGATGYKLSWYKELAVGSGQFTPNSEDIDGFSQSFIARLATTSADNAERAKELSQGRFVVVYESRYKGADNAEAFKVLGMEAGLELAEMTQNTNESSGSILFTLSTREGTFEQYPYQILLNTDYATTKGDVDALFAAVV